MSKKTYQRLKALAAQNGVDAVLQAIAGAVDLGTQAQDLGLQAKSLDDFGPLADLSDADLDRLVGDILALKEKREATAQQPAGAAVATGEAADAAAIATAVKEAVTVAMQEFTDNLTGLFTNRTKEQIEADRKAADLEKKIKELTEQLTEIKTGPRATTDPRQLNGFRPTQGNPATQTPGATSKEAGQDGFQMIADKAVNM